MAMVLTSCSPKQDVPPKPYGAIPDAEQLVWQNMEYYMLVTPNFDSTRDSDIESSYFDCRQWAATAKAAGMRGIVLVAKNNKGLCLWPSNFSSNTIRKSKWKGGKGDLLRDLSDACKEYDLKFGLSLSLSDSNDPTYGTAEYNQVFAGMLTEILSNYGNIFELHLKDSKSQPWKLQLYDWKLFLKIIKKNQPSTIICTDIGPGARTIVTNTKNINQPIWSTLNVDQLDLGGDNTMLSDSLNVGNVHGKQWVPAQTIIDLSDKNSQLSSEFIEEGLKSVDQLNNAYYSTIGRNANLVLNVSLNDDGFINREDSIRLMQFRRSIEDVFFDDLIETAKISASQIRDNSDQFAELGLKDANYNSYWATDDSVKTATLEVTFRKDRTFNRILLQEYIPLGQRIEQVSVQYLVDNDWVHLTSATTIGYKRILCFPLITTKQLRINVEKSLAAPILNKLSVYHAPESLSEPLISRDKQGNISISCTTNDPIIYYTTDGTRPTAKSNRYDKPFLSPGISHVRAIAMINEHKDKSKIVSKRYDIAPVNWTIVSSHPDLAMMAIDGNDLTYADIYKNQTLTIDFNEELNLKGFYYVPSKDLDANNVFRYNLYTSLDGQKWTKVLDNQSFSNMQVKPVRHNVLFKYKVKARYLKLMNLETVKRGAKYSVAEVGVLTK